MKVPQTIQDLAEKFQVDALPPTASTLDRLDYLYYWTTQAGQVIDLLPQPDLVEATVFQDMAAIKDDLLKLAHSAAVNIAAAPLRNFLLLAFVAAQWGVSAHHPAARAALLKTGDVTEADLESDYRRRLGIMQGIVKLGKSGALDVLFAQKQQLGLDPFTLTVGGTTVTIAGWIVVSVVAIAAVVLAFTLVALTALFLFNKMVDKWCFDDQGNPREKTAEDCPKLFSDAASLAQGPKDMLSSAVTYAAIGLGIYAAITFMPDIIRSIKESRSAARA